VTVANLGEYNGRAIINLCLRTVKSHPYNATISFPKDWKKASQFKPGDQVVVAIANGYVKNLLPAKAEPVRSVKTAEVIITEPIKEVRGAEADASIKHVHVPAAAVDADEQQTPF